ncbi:MAG: hypothetical protein ABFD07_19450 [Methanobacterium sp.]
MYRRFTGYEHEPTGKRFRKYENAYKYALKWGKSAGSGFNIIYYIDKDCSIKTIFVIWS